MPPRLQIGLVQPMRHARVTHSPAVQTLRYKPLSTLCNPKYSLILQFGDLFKAARSSRARNRCVTAAATMAAVFLLCLVPVSTRLAAEARIPATVEPGRAAPGRRSYAVLAIKASCGFREVDFVSSMVLMACSPTRLQRHSN